jgi:hypothetical protein
MCIFLVHGAWGWFLVLEGCAPAAARTRARGLCAEPDGCWLAPSHPAGHVLLIGHSYGGMVITGAADREIGPHPRHDLSRRLRAAQRAIALGPDRAGSGGTPAPGREKHDGGLNLPYHFGRPGEVPPTIERPYTPQPAATLSKPYVSLAACRPGPTATTSPAGSRRSRISATPRPSSRARQAGASARSPPPMTCR